MRGLRKVGWLVGLLVALVALARPAPMAAQAGGSADWPIPNGRFFTQAGGGVGGFSVVDDGQARFWAEFQRLGGAQTVGYPISQRYVYDGFQTQAFQKLVLQWRPEVNQAWPINVFDELSEAGQDEALLAFRQTPRPLVNFDPPGATWGQIVANRQALLNANGAIRARYFAVADPLNVFGLPVSRVEDMGNHWALRTQRAVFQQWKEAVPWASAGQVTIANGGDIAKEFRWFPPAILQPEAAPGAGAVWNPVAMAIETAAPHRLYFLQRAPNVEHYRLLVSDTLGATWQPFAGGLPVGDDCYLPDLTLDYATPGAVYLTTCQGFYRWTGSAWSLVAQGANEVTSGNPQQVWSYGLASVRVSDDGGATWREAASGLNGGTSGLGLVGSLHVDRAAPHTAYAMLGVGRSGTTIVRATVGGQWEGLFPEPSEIGFRHYTVQLDQGTGALWLGVPQLQQLWRIPNPTAPNVADVRWESVSTVSGDTNSSLTLLAAGTTPQGVALFASVNSNFYAPYDGTYTLYRSLDSGQTWQPLVVSVP